MSQADGGMNLASAALLATVSVLQHRLTAAAAAAC